MQPIDIHYYLRKRYLVIGLSFLGYVILFILRVNLSVCLVDITSNKTVTTANSTFIQEAEYNWTPSEIGIILSSFSWGFLTTPLTVIFVSKYGAARMFSFAIFSTGILTIISPMLIQSGLHMYVIGRFLEGVFEGLAVSASFGIFANWIPPKEKSRLINFNALGVQVGVSLGYPLSGYINYIFSWEYVFYVTGAMAICWSLLWTSFVRNSPANDSFISKKEKLYLETVIETTEKKKTTSLWKSMLTSKPVLAYLNELFVESWSVSFLTYCLPFFIKAREFRNENYVETPIADVHDVDINEIGIFASLPHFCDIISRTICSCYQDHLRCKGTMSKTKIHKLFIMFGQISAVVILLVAGIWKNFYACLILFCLFKICFTVAETSYWVIPLDLALGHSATLEAFVAAVMSIGYFLNPLVMSFMVVEHTYSEWSHYFWFLGLFNLWGLFVFSRYGSAEPQAWIYSDELSVKESNDVSAKQ